MNNNREERKQQRRKKQQKRKKILAVATVVIIVIVALMIGFAAGGRPVDRTSSDKFIVRIAEGSGSGAIADTLKKEDVIRSPFVFKVVSRLTGKANRFKSGPYAVAKNMSSKEIMNMIEEGDTAGKVFTVAEGTPLYKLAKQLDEAGIMTEQEFYDEVEHGQFDYDFMKYLPEGAARLEGFLYPDTYDVTIDATPHEIMDTMLKRFDQAVKTDDNTYKMITKASVIEKEASTEEDMKKVSSVIDNRLNKGMYLQMDSIVSYIHQEDKIRATLDDIKVKSSYNPYQNKGLPPGPICSPGAAAIDAAQHPADTDYLYFVADPSMDGTNVYSETYEEFLKDKKAFNKAYEKYIKEHPTEK